MYLYLCLQSLAKRVQDSLAEANEVAEETCSSMRTVRSFANELTEGARYAAKLGITYKLKVKEAFAYAGYVWCHEVGNETRFVILPCYFFYITRDIKIKQMSWFWPCTPIPI